MSDFKDTLSRDIDALRQLRDELKLQIHLAKAEARDRWDKLETKWTEIEARSADARREPRGSSSTSSGMNTTSSKALSEIDARGAHRLRLRAAHARTATSTSLKH